MPGIEVSCPMCGAQEVGPDGLLDVRGLKVGDNQGRWWSQCISGLDHGTTLVNYPDGHTVEVPIPAEPWFCQLDETTFLIEIFVDGKKLDVTCYGEREEETQ